jgi:hypothetical protein
LPKTGLKPPPATVRLPARSARPICCVPGLTVIRLTPHPEHRDGVAGFLQRSAGGEPAVARVSGDVDEGIFTLEESEDGRRIAATWSGAFKEDSCGRTITGSWWRDNTDQRRAFELHKQIGWD